MRGGPEDVVGTCGGVPHAADRCLTSMAGAAAAPAARCASAAQRAGWRRRSPPLDRDPPPQGPQDAPDLRADAAAGGEAAAAADAAGWVAPQAARPTSDWELAGTVER